MAKQFDVNIHGKETLSTAADQAVKGLNRLRAQIQAVQNTAKFFAGGAIGFQFLRFFGDSVEAFRKSEEAAVKLGRAMSPSALAITNLGTAFGDLKVAAGESFATGARPVVEWLAQVASDGARAQREINAAKRALDSLAAGNTTVRAADAVRGLNDALTEAERALAGIRGRPGTASAQVELEKRIANLKEEIRLQASAARAQSVGEDAMRRNAEALALINKEWPTTIEGQVAAAEGAIELAEAFRFAPLATEDLEKLNDVIRKLYGNLNRIKPKPIKFEIPEAPAVEGPTEAELDTLKMVYEAQVKATGAAADYWSAQGQGAAGFLGSGQAVLDMMEKQKAAAAAAAAQAEVLLGVWGTFAEDVGTAMVEGGEAWKDAFKNVFGTMLAMLAKTAFANAAAALFPIIGGINFPAAAAWFAAGTAAMAASGAIQAMAQGGTLWEPVLGTGLHTGQRYLMGEAGPETLVPGAWRGGGGVVNNITNVNVRGSVVTRDEMFKGALNYGERAYRRH